jgi:hypothetical protein
MPCQAFWQIRGSLVYPITSRLEEPPAHEQEQREQEQRPEETKGVPRRFFWQPGIKRVALCRAIADRERREWTFEPMSGQDNEFSLHTPYQLDHLPPSLQTAYVTHVTTSVTSYH